MEIYVVQQGDTIYSIADKYGVSAARLILDNELDNPEDLVIGQTIIITYPKQIHTVKEGDTLAGIADTYGVTVMQLLRNNPFLPTREYIYPGETIIISYNTIDIIATHGFCYTYINHEELIKTLPNLTYLSIFNYRVTGEGELVSYSDDTEVIRTAKTYGTAPLMMTTTLTPQGEPNIELAYMILLNEEYQDRIIENVLNVLKEKGYYGLNVVINYLNTTNQKLYLNFMKKVSERLNKEGYIVFATVNPNVKNEEGELIYEKVDYNSISQVVNAIIFLQFVWGTNTGPPEPVSSIQTIKEIVDYAASIMEPAKIIIGKPVISYDWTLPYVPGRSSAYSMTLHSTLSLAHDASAEFKFDETSQTPYFMYYQYGISAPIEHIVWSVDARSIDAINRLVHEYKLGGTGVWNIMVYLPQMWLVTNSQFDIEKVFPVG